MRRTSWNHELHQAITSTTRRIIIIIVCRVILASRRVGKLHALLRPQFRVIASCFMERDVDFLYEIHICSYTLRARLLFKHSFASHRNYNYTCRYTILLLKLLSPKTATDRRNEKYLRLMKLSRKIPAGVVGNISGEGKLVPFGSPLCFLTRICIHRFGIILYE